MGKYQNLLSMMLIYRGKAIQVQLMMIIRCVLVWEEYYNILSMLLTEVRTYKYN